MEAQESLPSSETVKEPWMTGMLAEDARFTWRIVVKNYRCFADEPPVQFELGSKFIAFVGPSNSGESSVLKMFLELRPIFTRLVGNISNIAREILNGKE